MTTDLSNARLEPFLLMSKSARGAGAAKLIMDATSAPGVFVFAELLEVASVQDLKNHEQHAPYYALLELFSYKTYEDYVQNKSSYPTLNTSQIAKLKHLSLATYAMTRRILPYSTLQSALDVPSIRALEDVIIDAMYLDIIRGKLDQKHQHFQVEWVMGRDLAPGALEGILKGLKAWANTTSSLLSTLDSTISSIHNTTLAQKETLDMHSATQQKVLAEVLSSTKSNTTAGLSVPMPLRSRKNEGGASSGGGGAFGFGGGSGMGSVFGGIMGGGSGGGSADAMDVDEQPGWERRKKAATDTAAGKSAGRKRNRF